MKRFAITIISTLTLGLLIQTGQAQPTCDFGISQTSPTMSWYDNNGTQYTTWGPGSQNWEIDTSILSRAGSGGTAPYVLHTNPGQGNGAQSPRYLTSQAISGFNWSYNELQWSFWFGRGQGVGQNGGNNDGSIVWLYVNTRTGIDNLRTPGLEGIKVSWHHSGNDDLIRLSEVYGGTEYIVGDVVLISNLSLYEWGATVMVKRIPGGLPTGSQVTYELYMSTPDASTPNFATYSVDANSDPVAASTYKRIDTTLTSPWTPSSTTGYLGVHSYYANSRKEAAEYNQLCFQDFGPVPVELSSFTAEYRNDLVDLNWQTATELNNFGFEVQRAIENDGEWETIAFIDGHGTSNSPHEYDYTDAPNADGAATIAYRLKQIDRDGAYEYSNTVHVAIAPRSVDVLYNYPNPFNPTTSIRFNLASPGTVTLKVYNASGQLIRELYDNEFLEAGYHTAGFSGEGLPAGSYFFRLRSSAGTKTNSMVLSK